MGRMLTKRTGWVVAVAAALTTAVGAGLPAQADTQRDTTVDRGGAAQVAFLNHTYSVLDPATVQAISGSAYLKRFASYEERTTTNGQTTYTGRYLMGRETYLEIFPEGALPAPDDQRGTTGLALGTDRAGDLATVTQRLTDLGATPWTFTQTKVIDGDPVPWFDVVTPVTTYEAGFPWVMEYLPSYFADPRSGLTEPASFPGDVSRERYLRDDYRDHLMKDVIGLDAALPQADLNAFALTLRAAGYVVKDTRAGTVAVGRGSVVRLTAAPDSASGWKRIVFSLNTSQRTQHVERLGSSTLRVGPGPVAVWNFG